MTLSLRLIWEDLRKEFGERIEPFESWRNADDLRKYWRPENVKVVLFAESHVFTKLDEMSIRVQHSRFTDDPIPDSFVKLVYCLGYGENELLSQCLESNFGTRQFWEIFYSGLHRVESTSDFVSIRKTKTRNLDDRIQNKLEILREMKALGIWLLDASLAALYPKTHLPGGMYQACMQKSWPYVSALIAEANPERIVVIGKTMWRTFLCHQLPSLGIPCFLQSQPQARMTTQERMEMFGNYYDLFHGNGCFEQTSCKKESKQPANKTKRQASKDKGASCEWTLNGRHGYYTRGGLSLQQSPILLTLNYQPLGSVPKRLVCEQKELDLNRLLNDGFIRRDPVGSTRPFVRVRIVCKDDRRFYIQAGDGYPKCLLG